MITKPVNNKTNQTEEYSNNRISTQPSSLTSSNVKRIRRKTDQTSISQRSESRRSSQKSLQLLDMSKFYTKMNSLQLTNESTLNSQRQTILTRSDSLHKNKKRTPTPIPGYVIRKKQKQIMKQSELIQIENNILISQLQNKYNAEQQKVKTLQYQLLKINKQLKSKSKRIQELQIRLGQMTSKQRIATDKLIEMQEKIKQNETRHQQTRTTLEKLKKSIVQNRYAELESDNLQFRKNIEKMKKRVTELEQENKKWANTCKQIEQELYLLTSSPNLLQFQQEMSETTDSIKESTTPAKEQYILKLQSTIAKLQIKINHLQRTNIQSAEKITNKKNQELHKVRTHLSKVNQQLKQIKQQYNLFRKNFLNPSTNTKRTTLMTYKTWPQHDEPFSLSLSPEHQDS